MINEILECAVIPLLIILAAVLSVIAMTARNWAELHAPVPWGGGQILLAELSPWGMCTARCKDCRSYPLWANMDCHWVWDSGQVATDHLGAVRQLEYWSLGAVILALIALPVGYLDRQLRQKPLDWRWPVLALLAFTSTLSGVSLKVFSDRSRNTLQELMTDTTDHHVHQVFAEPFYLRIFATSITGISAFLTIYQLVRSWMDGGRGAQRDEERMTMVPTREDEAEEDFPEEYGIQL